jgi:hypothetical protein
MIKKESLHYRLVYLSMSATQRDRPRQKIHNLHPRVL